MPSAQGHITVRRRPKDGTNGNDAVRYWLVPSATQVKRAQDGTVSPTTVTCERRKQSGSSTPIATTEGLLYYQIGQTNGLQSAKTSYSSTGVTVSSTTAWIKFIFEINGLQVATETVSVVNDGKDGIPGKQGLQGCIYRRSRFANNFNYHNDSALTTEDLRYIDLVYIMTDSTMYASHAKWFRCKKTHTSNASNAPKATSNGTEPWLEYWEPMNTMEPIYTPLLLADDAIITLMQSNQILIESDEGVITAGLSGSLSGKKIRIWAGASTPDNAPFRVDAYGAFVATKAEITGTVNATAGTIAGFNISGNSLTNGPDFDNDACIIFRNDAHKTFAGIGGNVLPASTGARAVARFENCDELDQYGVGANYAMIVSARGSRTNIALAIDGGYISGLALRNTIVSSTTPLSRSDTNVLAINTSAAILTLPTMQTYDDGHVIRIKRLGSGSLKLRLGYCYTYNGFEQRYSRPCLIYDKNETLTGTNELEFISVCDAFELVWCRDLVKTINNVTYYGCWVQYKLPRDW